MNAPAQTPAVRKELRQAGVSLGDVCDALKKREVDYDALYDLLSKVTRLCPQALLRWHSHPEPENLSLYQLHRRAQSLASSLRLPLRRMRIQLAQAKESGRPTVQTRELLETSFYTARNLYRTTLIELPDVVTTDAPFTDMPNRLLSPYRISGSCHARAVRPHE